MGTRTGVVTVVTNLYVLTSFLGMCIFSPTNDTHSINLCIEWKLLATYSPRLLLSFRVVFFVLMRRQSHLSQ